MHPGGATALLGRRKMGQTHSQRKFCLRSRAMELLSQEAVHQDENYHNPSRSSLGSATSLAALLAVPIVTKKLTPLRRVYSFVMAMMRGWVDTNT